MSSTVGLLKGPTLEEKVFAALKTSLECDRPTWKSYAMEKKVNMHCMHTRMSMLIVYQRNMQYALNVQTSKSNK